MHHELDDALGAWHLGAGDATGRVVAISTFNLVATQFDPRLNPQSSCGSWQSNRRSRAGALVVP